MNKTQQSKQKNIRFRRWSRVGYAVFVSLSAVVSIGFLSVSISDKLLLKNLTVDIKAENSLELCNSELEDEICKLELSLEQTNTMLVNQQVSNDALKLYSKINYI